MKLTKTLLCVALTLAASMLFSVRPALAGQKVYVGGKCNHAEHPSLDAVDHSTWDGLLRKYVSDRGLVDYAGWRQNAADMRALDDYLNSAGCVDLKKPASTESQLAFWINLYNAMTVKGILRDYPVASIKDLQSHLGGYHIWKDLLITVDGRHYSLEQIEHEVLRPMGEPRVHFAIVCASIGCPKLRNEVYTAARLNEQLTASARDFFADPQKFSADARSRTVSVSPILKWFAEDFGADQSKQLQTIRLYVPAQAQSVLESRSARVRYVGYDWSLNDQKRAGR